MMHLLRSLPEPNLMTFLTLLEHLKRYPMSFIDIYLQPFGSCGPGRCVFVCVCVNRVLLQRGREGAHQQDVPP